MHESYYSCDRGSRNCSINSFFGCYLKCSGVSSSSETYVSSSNWGYKLDVLSAMCKILDIMCFIELLFKKVNYCLFICTSFEELVNRRYPVIWHILVDFCAFAGEMPPGIWSFVHRADIPKELLFCNGGGFLSVKDAFSETGYPAFYR